MALTVRNWSKFQHYKGRRPPWIKLHRELLEDRAFLSLPLAAQALAPRLWLLASESEDGSLPDDPADLEFRLRCSQAELIPAVNSLIAAKFLSGRLQPASDLLAECEQVATPEKETEESRREAEERQIAPAAAAALATASSTDPPPKSWSAEACDDWAAHLGTPIGDRIGKALKFLIRDHTWAVVRPLWQAALVDAAGWDDPGRFTPEQFGRTFIARLNASRRPPETALVPGAARGSPSPKASQRERAMVAMVKGGLKA